MQDSVEIRDTGPDDTRRKTAPSGTWALTTDGLQWILLRRISAHAPWKPLSYVHSTKDVLARCMREKGVADTDAQVLLDGLPHRFDDWQEHGGDFSVHMPLVPTRPQTR